VVPPALDVRRGEADRAIVGDEIADRCDFVIAVPFVTLSNNSVWHVQGEWSNAAFDAATGDTNTLGEHGCLYGR